MIAFDYPEGFLLAHVGCGEVFSAGTWTVLIESSFKNGTFYECPKCGRPITSSDDLVPEEDPKVLKSADWAIAP